MAGTATESTPVVYPPPARHPPESERIARQVQGAARRNMIRTAAFACKRTSIRMPGPKDYPAEKARQGYVALNTPARRWVFFGGLVAFVILMIVLSFATGWMAL